MTRSVKLSGMGASAGAAVGRAFLIDRRQVQEPREHIAAERVVLEIARLHDAIQRSDEQLADIRGRLASQPQEHGLIIEAHRLMLSDPTLVQGAEALIRGEQINAEWAVRRVIKEDGLAGLFGRGLSTKIVSNGFQGLMFSVLWKLIDEKLQGK